VITGLPRLDVESFADAVFPGHDSFPHLSDPEHTNCPACNTRMLFVRPIEMTDDYTLMEASLRLPSDRIVVIPETWLNFSRVHAETLDEMPDHWTACNKRAVRTLGIGTPFCTSENWGKEAGQTLRHGHSWIIGRGILETGLISENTGLATILLRIKQHGVVMSV
jgi:hypothetical protein